MILSIDWLKRVETINPGLTNNFQKFFQKCANRIIHGAIQYGKTNSNRKYLTRLDLEVKAYKKTGNAEYLYNIANYAFLEYCAPEHKKHHENNEVDSITRGKV